MNNEKLEELTSETVAKISKKFVGHRAFIDDFVERTIQDYGKTLLALARDDGSAFDAPYAPEVIATSQLAKVEIAADDYNIGGKEVDGKHYFTFGEAQEVQKILEDTGWRLPTRSEWVLICEEFGQKDGELDCEALYKNLNMKHTGWIGEDGDLHAPTTVGYWWSDTASSATDGRNLVTWPGNVNAQGSNWRGSGFALRLVRDVKESE